MLSCKLVKPSSLCFDDLGIYFNPKNNSRLEEILKGEIKTEGVEELINNLKTNKISKYGDIFNFNINIKTNKKIILIPGQVLGDASIKYGSVGEIKNNLDLVKEVRRTNPEAYIIYKEHPDVVVKKRKAENINLFKEYCDLTVQKGNIIELIEEADEIHTLTSTTGLEAIIRDKKVVCYGFPFYAGYGLTEDKIKFKERPKITKEKLIAGCLIEYPTYLI